MLAAVTFDFWNTLVHDSPDNITAQTELRLAALGRALERAGAALDERGVREAYERSGHLLMERFWGRHRDLSLRDQVRVVLDCCAPGLAERMPAAFHDEVAEAYAAPVLSYPPPLSPGAAEAVRSLAARGLTLAIISNTGRTPGSVLRRVLERHDLLRHFRVIIYSDEVGYRKPAPEIFRLTLERAGIRAHEAAHVGDNPVDDVMGAQAVGMRGVHYAAEGRSPADHADLTIESLGKLADALFRVAS